MAEKKNIFKTLSRQYSNPKKIQGFLKTFTYNKEVEYETVQSAITTLHSKTVHCLEATILTAAILEHKGFPPLLLSLDSVDHLCHAIFVFKTKTGWGAVAKSREPGLHGREPRFRSIRDLVSSYFEPFVDKTGRITGFALLNLNDSDTDWRFSKRNLWKLEQFVVTAKHTKFKSSKSRFLNAFKKYNETGGTPRSGKYWW